MLGRNGGGVESAGGGGGVGGDELSFLSPSHLFPCSCSRSTSCTDIYDADTIDLT